MTLRDLPTLNAILNATAALLLISGYLLIRRGRRAAHQRAMIAAFACSTLFLVGYLTYHAKFGSTPFPGQGAVRTLYFTILLSHTVLAAAVPVLAILTLTRGLRGRFPQHVRIARWTLPIWLYVSVTGVAIYWMLYRVSY